LRVSTFCLSLLFALSSTVSSNPALMPLAAGPESTGRPGIDTNQEQEGATAEQMPSRTDARGLGLAQDEWAAQLASVVDAILGKAVSDEDVPGAVVLVVKDGRVVFQRGYGFADLKTRRPVDPERTLFYLASLTKTFMATAAMQMVEQGKLELHADVNRTLKTFQVDHAYSEPVTLAHLLTHTAGFDDRNIGYVAHTAAEAEPLAIYLSHALPPRVRPPGIVTSYSNHGYGLAGDLVEIVSGRHYADYLEENIFHPLGMRRTTARIPLPAELAADLATGYEYDFRTGRGAVQARSGQVFAPAAPAARA
jgi:CubicO group peptidase (beta-lactamase class C family)